jgi:hypothetical protein
MRHHLHTYNRVTVIYLLSISNGNYACIPINKSELVLERSQQHINREIKPHFVAIGFCRVQIYHFY